MTQIMDRLNRELESFGRRAQAALDEGKLGDTNAALLG